ncbi:MAG: hypothetical protein H6741_15410 [Alphaproteobacteria bacterium]|nr:hypothetical protein [Alphaproteobacteria bacterium]MCB9794102.1 hypothetical protein [Alphaproteobacteria bacterium]
MLTALLALTSLAWTPSSKPLMDFDPTRLLICELPEGYPRAAAAFMESDPYSDYTRALQHLELRGGEILIPVFEPSGQGRLSPEGLPDLHVTWDKLVCAPIQVPEATKVCGRVKGTLGTKAWLVINGDDEGVGVPTRRSGRFCAYVGRTPADLVASRWEGWEQVQVETTWDPEAPGPAATLPHRRQGGVGMLATPLDEDRLEILRVAPGMPAAEVGLEAGMIVRVDEPSIGDLRSTQRVEILEGERAGEVLELRRARFSARVTTSVELVSDEVLVTTSSAPEGSLLL